MKRWSRGSLSECNGKGGRPVLIAYEGKVYDVSHSELWKTGIHMGRHRAGNDLTKDIQAAPHGPEVIGRFSQVGVLEDVEDKSTQLPTILSWMTRRFPILSRHPHPMVVHFPIVFSISSAGFALLYLITGLVPLEATAFHCLAGAVLFIPPAGLTGWLTWWINYQRRPMRAVKIKLFGTSVLMCLAVGALVWRALDPDILRSFDTISIPFLVMVLLMVPTVTLVGWHGAMLTFPVERR
jgi:predicted heme/steroid binding protein/uncharacterized membrane protein